MSFPTSFWLLPQKSHWTPSTSDPLGIELSIVGQRGSLTPNAESGTSGTCRTYSNACAFWRGDRSSPRVFRFRQAVHAGPSCG